MYSECRCESDCDEVDEVDCIPSDQWNDWRWQLRNRVTTKAGLEEHITLTDEEISGCDMAKNKLLFAITPYYLNLFEADNPNCPIRRQVVPLDKEAFVSADELLDPVGEDSHSPVSGIVHRYPDRVLFLVTDRCAAYCRYCTRSRMVSNAQDYNFHPELEEGINYIESNPAIRDVLLSGGDPLLLSDEKLDYLIGRLKAIPHVELVRIGSRVPVFLPQRITESLTDVFKKHGPVWMNIHVNHPKECTGELMEACTKLAYAGVPLGNQSVLLKGINDDLETMRTLIHKLLMMRVRPYYLYQCDLITGSAHLRADVRKGIEIIKGLRGFTTGFAVPQFVIDAPGGGGKVPINPDYIEKIDDKEIVFRNYEGKQYKYPIVE